MKRYYPETPKFPPYSELKPFSAQRPKFKFPWDTRESNGEILDEIEQEEYVTWPDGTIKVYKNLIQLVHWEFEPKGVTELRFCYYKTEFRQRNPYHLGVWAICSHVFTRADVAIHG